MRTKLRDLLDADRRILLQGVLMRPCAAMTGFLATMLVRRAMSGRLLRVRHGPVASSRR